MSDKTKNLEKVLAELNESWLNGTYDDGEINTNFPFISVKEAIDGEDYFAQGDEAQKNIEEIFQIWVNSDLTTEQAFNQWININF